MFRLHFQILQSQQLQLKRQLEIQLFQVLCLNRYYNINEAIIIKKNSILFLIRTSLRMKKQPQSLFEKTDFQLHSSLQNMIITVITWNLYGSVPPMNQLFRLFKSKTFSQPPDVIFFATQECQKSLQLSFFCEGKQQWEDMLKQILDSKYQLQCSMTMQGLHSAVFVRNSLIKTCTIQRKDYLKAGTCNLVGNKGAISILMNVYGQNLQFVNCHLAAHQNQNYRRNQTLLRVLSQVVDKDLRTQVFLCGDLNYRIQIQKQQYKNMTKQRQNTERQMKYTSFLQRDQLKNQQELSRIFLAKFREDPIKFPPTYKLSTQKQEYSKQRIPGWTDRIFNRNGRSKQIAYCCEYQIKGSDHRPVIASYDLTIEEGLSVLPDDRLHVQVKSQCNLI